MPSGSTMDREPRSAQCGRMAGPWQTAPRGFVSLDIWKIFLDHDRVRNHVVASMCIFYFRGEGLNAWAEIIICSRGERRCFLTPTASANQDDPETAVKSHMASFYWLVNVPLLTDSDWSYHLSPLKQALAVTAIIFDYSHSLISEVRRGRLRGCWCVMNVISGLVM